MLACICRVVYKCSSVVSLVQIYMNIDIDRIPHFSPIAFFSGLIIMQKPFYILYKVKVTLIKVQRAPDTAASNVTIDYSTTRNSIGT